MKPSEVTQNQFYGALEGIVDGMTAGEVLGIPGVYEVLAEALNNAVLGLLCDDSAE